MRTITVNPVAVCGTDVSSLENALAILGLFDANRPVLRVGEVCRDLAVPKSSVSRLMKTMGEHGLIERQDGEFGYVVGQRALQLADLYLSRHTLLDLVDLTLNRLVLEFGFVCYAGVLSGRDLVVLRLKHGAYPLRLVQPVGKRLPAYDTAIGRALLSRLSDHEAAVVAGTDGPASSADVLAELDRVHCSGLAATISTTIPGIAAIGAAAHNPLRNEAIGFSVSFPLSATDSGGRLQMARRVRGEAAAIAARIGDPYWAGRATTQLSSHEVEAALGHVQSKPSAISFS